MTCIETLACIQVVLIVYLLQIAFWVTWKEEIQLGCGGGEGRGIGEVFQRSQIMQHF